LKSCNIFYYKSIF